MCSFTFFEQLFPNLNISQKFIALWRSCLVLILRDIIVRKNQTKNVHIFPVSEKDTSSSSETGWSFPLEAWFPMGRTISYATLFGVAHYHLVSELHP